MLTANYTLERVPQRGGGVRYKETIVNNSDPSIVILGTIYLSQYAARLISKNGSFPQELKITVEVVNAQ